MMAYEGHRNFFIICPGKSTLSVDCLLTISKTLTSLTELTILILTTFTITRRFGRPTADLLLAPAEGWGALRALLGAFGPLSLLPKVQMAEIWTFKKSKMAAMFPNWLPVIDMGAISLSSEFQPYCSSSG